MLTLLRIALWTVGVPLEILVIWALSRGPYRRFLFVFAYSIALFLSTLVEIAAYTTYTIGGRNVMRPWRDYYWINDVILYLLVSCVVISLIYQALGQARVRWRALALVILLLALVSAASFVYHYEPGARVTIWMTQVSRNLSFAAAILDFFLWMLLIAKRQPDQTLLLVVGGLGIEGAAVAIGHALRQLSPALAIPGGLVVALGSLLRMYIWFQAFRPRARTAWKHNTA